MRQYFGGSRSQRERGNVRAHNPSTLMRELEAGYDKADRGP